ncbi:MAG: hypothetical protein ABJB34_02925 [Acidobacteriota bacterium]
MSAPDLSSLGGADKIAVAGCEGDADKTAVAGSSTDAAPSRSAFPSSRQYSSVSSA